MNWKIGSQIICNQNFVAKSPEDLSFTKGDILTIIANSQRSNCFFAQKIDGAKGLIPASMCQPISNSSNYWLHGRISREEAETILKSQPNASAAAGGIDGAFLIRESTNFPGDYTLCLLYQGIVEHYHIIHTNNITRENEEICNNNITDYNFDSGNSPSNQQPIINGKSNKPHNPKYQRETNSLITGNYKQTSSIERFTIDNEIFFQTLEALVEHYTNVDDGLVCLLKHPISAPVNSHSRIGSLSNVNNNMNTNEKHMGCTSLHSNGQNIRRITIDDQIDHSKTSISPYLNDPFIQPTNQINSKRKEQPIIAVCNGGHTRERSLPITTHLTSIKTNVVPSRDTTVTGIGHVSFPGFTSLSDKTDTNNNQQLDLTLTPALFKSAGWAIKPEALRLPEPQESIGRGEFGHVLLGYLRNRKVAVKALRKQRTLNHHKINANVNNNINIDNDHVDDNNIPIPMLNGNINDNIVENNEGRNNLCDEQPSHHQMFMYERFLAEASIMTGIKHPNIVRFLGVVFEPIIHKQQQKNNHDITPSPLNNRRPNFHNNNNDANTQSDVKNANLTPALPNVYMVLEYMPHGSLLEFLRSRGRTILTTRKLLGFAEDICKGMMYLESKHIAHRDLAARNVLLDQNEMAKISDFGLAKEYDPFTICNNNTNSLEIVNNNENMAANTTSTQNNSKTDNDSTNFYEAINNVNSNNSVIDKNNNINLTTGFQELHGKFPIKWTAPEALRDNNKFSSKSDIWSFGVLLWEIFSFGKIPYSRIPLCDVVKHIEKGYRLECPEGCPEHLYTKLMLNCWDLNAGKRPTFLQIHNQNLLKNT